MVNKEMFLSFIINFIFGFTMLCPLFYTGIFIIPSKNSVNHPLLQLVSVKQINNRHSFLTKLIGTKEEEDYSYEMANYLQVLITTCFFVFSFMEMAMFYVYNLKVNYETRFIKSYFDFLFL